MAGSASDPDFIGIEEVMAVQSRMRRSGYVMAFWLPGDLDGVNKEELEAQVRRSGDKFVKAATQPTDDIFGLYSQSFLGQLTRATDEEYRFRQEERIRRYEAAVASLDWAAPSTYDSPYPDPYARGDHQAIYSHYRAARARPTPPPLTAPPPVATQPVVGSGESSPHNSFLREILSGLGSSFLDEILPDSTPSSPTLPATS